MIQEALPVQPEPHVGNKPMKLTVAENGTLLVQGDFFYDDPEQGAELLRAQAPAGKHSGERVERDWERVLQILEDYASFLPLRAICRRNKCHHRVVTSLVQRHRPTVDTLKQRVRAGLERFALMSTERLEVEGHMIPIHQLPIQLAIAIDKIQVLEMGESGGEREQKAVAKVDPRSFLEQFLAPAGAGAQPVLDVVTTAIQSPEQGVD